MQKLIQESKGFTLFEILIAVAILSLMGIAIAQVTTRSFDVNMKLGSEADNIVSVATTIESLDRDISQMYSPIISESKPLEGGRMSDFWSAPLREDGLRRMRLIGESTKLSFISAANRRLYQDSPESDLLKVTWEVIQDSDGSLVLARTADADAFDYEDLKSKTKLKQHRILEGINNATFSYYFKEKDVWDSQWDSEAPFREHKDRYPDIIAINIEVPDAVNPSIFKKWRAEFTSNLFLNFVPPTDDKNNKAKNGKTKPPTGGLF